MELQALHPGNVLILGGGVVGENAAIIATGMQAKVFIVDKSPQLVCKNLEAKFGDRIIPLNSQMKLVYQDYMLQIVIY